MLGPIAENNHWEKFFVRTRFGPDFLPQCILVDFEPATMHCGKETKAKAKHVVANNNFANGQFRL